MSKFAAIRHVSRDIEVETGCDSVDTIERFQLCDDDARNSCDEPCGEYHCVYPRCTFKSRYSNVVWLHEVFGHEGGTGPGVLGWTLDSFIKEMCP